MSPQITKMYAKHNMDVASPIFAHNTQVDTLVAEDDSLQSVGGTVCSETQTECYAETMSHECVVGGVVKEMEREEYDGPLEFGPNEPIPDHIKERFMLKF